MNKEVGSHEILDFMVVFALDRNVWQRQISRAYPDLVGLGQTVIGFW